MTDTSKYIIAGGSESTVMVRRNSLGQIEETESERVPYDPIPKGQYDLEITGFQAPFEVPRDSRFPKEDWQSDTVTKTRLEFTVISGEYAGASFLCRYSATVGERATLGKLLRAITQKPIARPWDMTSMIGLTFSATVVLAKDQQTGQVKTGRDGNPFPDIVIDTIEPFEAPAVPDELKSAPKQKPARELPMEQDPRISYAALWQWSGRWGINNVKDLEKITGKDLSLLGCSEMYDMISDLTKTNAA